MYRSTLTYFLYHNYAHFVGLFSYACVSFDVCISHRIRVQRWWCACCSVLQCVAVCCSVLQCVAEVVVCVYQMSRVIVLQCVAVWQCVGVCCNVLQCVAVCCRGGGVRVSNVSCHCVAVFCSVLQCFAVCCSALQCVAVCCRGGGVRE